MKIEVFGFNTVNDRGMSVSNYGILHTFLGNYNYYVENNDLVITTVIDSTSKEIARFVSGVWSYYLAEAEPEKEGKVVPGYAGDSPDNTDYLDNNLS